MKKWWKDERWRWFELSAGPQERFPKLTTTVSRDEAANMVAAGIRKLRDEADVWES